MRFQVSCPKNQIQRRDLQMSVQLLDKTRKINKLLHNNDSQTVVFNDICNVLSEVLDSNALVISRKGKVLGICNSEKVPVLQKLLVDEVGQHIEPELNERLLIILSTKENVNLLTLGFDGEDWQNRYFCFVTERSGAFEEYLSGLRGPQVPGTHPSHELKDYEGMYARDGYGDCVIREENGTLIMHFLSADCRLEHYHYDTFISKNIVGEIPPGLPVVFQISPQGEVIGVSMALVTEDGKYITFRKK